MILVVGTRVEGFSTSNTIVGKTYTPHVSRLVVVRHFMTSEADDGDSPNANDATKTAATTATTAAAIGTASVAVPPSDGKTKQAIETLMTEHDPILLFASRLLPPQKSKDASALYAWCRRLDEICDSEENAENYELVLEQLGTWQERFDALWSAQNDDDDKNNGGDNDYSEDEYLMDLALKNCIEGYQESRSPSSPPGEGTACYNRSLLTRQPFDDMIEGMKSDAVDGRRVRDMEELELYAYRVAGTVGLMLLPLLLSETNEKKSEDNNEATLLAIEGAREPAISLGKAIQLVNILRDATQDAKLGRIYLPQDMLQQEGINDENIIALGLDESSSPSRVPEGYKRVVRRVSHRAHELLAEAEGGKYTLPSPLGPLFVQIIVELYRDYLEELKRREYDNLSSSSNGSGEDRVKISTLRKIQASLRAVAKVFGELLVS